MKLRIAIAAVLAALFVVPAWAGGDYSKKDRAALVKYLKETQKNIEKATRGLSAEQWNFKQAADRWSVADCLEHLTVTEEFLRDGLIRDRVLKTTPAPEKKNAENQAKNDALVVKVIPDRSNRVQAPEMLRPTGKWPDPKDMLREFKARRKKTIEFVKTSNVDLRAYFMDSPVIKGMDAHQWVLFLSAHAARHTAQMLEVKADANFPKKKSGY